MKKLICAVGIFLSSICSPRKYSPKSKFSFFDGIAVVGYVDHDAFINFTGPNTSFKNKDFK